MKTERGAVGSKTVSVQSQLSSGSNAAYILLSYTVITWLISLNRVIMGGRSMGTRKERVGGCRWGDSHVCAADTAALVVAMVAPNIKLLILLSQSSLLIRLSHVDFRGGLIFASLDNMTCKSVKLFCKRQPQVSIIVYLMLR